MTSVKQKLKEFARWAVQPAEAGKSEQQLDEERAKLMNTADRWDPYGRYRRTVDKYKQDRSNDRGR